MANFFNGPLAVPNPNANFITSVMVSYMQQEESSVVSDVFPVIPSMATAGAYRFYPKGALLRRQMKPHKRGGAPEQAQFDADDRTFNITVNSLEKTVDDLEQFQASFQPLSQMRLASEYLASQSAMDLDYRFSSGYFKSSAWSSTLTGVASGPTTGQFLQWNQGGSDPIAFLRQRVLAMKLRGGYKANTITFGAEAYEALIANPSVRTSMTYWVEAGITNQAGIANLIGVDKVLVASSVENTAVEGLADNLQFIVSSKACLLTYAPKTASTNLPSAGYIFALNGKGYTSGAQQSMLNFALGVGGKSGYDARAGIEWVQGFTAYAMHVVAPDLGEYIDQVIP